MLEEQVNKKVKDYCLAFNEFLHFSYLEMNV